MVKWGLYRDVTKFKSVIRVGPNPLRLVSLYEGKFGYRDTPKRKNDVSRHGEK